MKNIKIWKKIQTSKYKDLNHLIRDLNKNGYVLSPWIENIFKNKKNKIKINNEAFNLYKIKVKNLGFKKPTQLKNIYKKIKLNNFMLVPPVFALRARFFYNEQKVGEWLRFATSFNSMIDTDKVPHLPKLGKALNKYLLKLTGLILMQFFIHTMNL